jgi:isoquinoline 1-oxidoreductase
VIEPDQAKMQREGCIMMGLGYTQTEEVRFEGGRILARNFETYELPMPPERVKEALAVSRKVSAG